MLAAVLEEEVNAFLGRHRYQRGQTFRGYRNGYHPARERWAWGRWRYEYRGWPRCPGN